MAITGILPPTIQFLPYTDNIVAGPVEYFAGMGTRLAVSTAVTGDDVWSGAATTIPIPASAGEQMTVVSTSANDTNGGTGINSVEIHYVDAAGNEQEEVIVLAGLVPVNTVATNIRFINEMYGITVGTGRGAAGTIHIYRFGDAARIYTQINAGHFKHSNTARMVPANKVCLIESFVASGGSAAGGKTATIQIRTTAHHGLLLPVSPNPVFHNEGFILVFNSGFQIKFDTPVLVPAFAVIKCTSFAAAAGADVASSWYGKLVTAPV